jgi:hypothetical protein
VLAAALTLGAAAMPAHAEPGVPVDLADAGSVTIWGGQYDASAHAYDADPAVTTVPDSLRNKSVTAVAATDNATLAVTADGELTVWGDTRYNNAYDLGKLPSGLKHVTSVCANNDNALALNSDGTVVAWGNSSTGITLVPQDIQGHVTQVACGQYIGMALLDNGTVTEWGNYLTDQDAPPEGLNDVVSIAAPQNSDTLDQPTNPFLAVKRDGSIVSWGSLSPTAVESHYDYGQYDIPDEVLNGNVEKVYEGRLINAALLTTGKAVFWGYAADQVPDQVTDASIADIAMGGYNMALTTDGHVFSWGQQVPAVDALMNAVPASVQGKATAIAVADDHEVVITPAFTIATAPIIGGTPTVGQALTLADATYGGGQDPDNVTTQWLANGTPIAGATGTSLPVTADLVGKTITVTQTATLGTGDDAQTLTATSDPFVIPAPPSGGNSGNTNPGGAVTKTSASIGKLILKPHKLAKLKKLPLAKLKKAKAVITVTTTGHTPTGTVTITLKNKHKKKSVTATLTNGHATLKLKKLAKAAKKGKNKLTLTYSGDTTTNPTTSHTKLKLK